MRTRRHTAFVLALLLLGSATYRARAENQTVMILRDGNQMAIATIRADGNRLFFRRTPTSPEAGIPFDDVRYVQFPTPPEFESARAQIAYGEHAEALRNLEAVLEEHEPHAGIPGNFHTQAQFWLLTNLLQSGQFNEIPARARGFRPQLLMPQLRTPARVLEGWAHLGAGRHERALEIANELLGQTGLPLSQQSDIWFLRGMARHRMGQAEAALEDFTSVFALGYGDTSAAKRQSFARILELLHTQERYREFKSFVELFRVNFSKGELPDRLQRLLDDLPDLPDEEDEWAGFTRAPDRLVSEGPGPEEAPTAHGAGRVRPQ